MTVRVVGDLRIRIIYQSSTVETGVGGCTAHAAFPIACFAADLICDTSTDVGGDVSVVIAATCDTVLKRVDDDSWIGLAQVATGRIDPTLDFIFECARLYDGEIIGRTK